MLWWFSSNCWISSQYTQVWAIALAISETILWLHFWAPSTALGGICLCFALKQGLSSKKNMNFLGGGRSGSAVVCSFYLNFPVRVFLFICVGCKWNVVLSEPTFNFATLKLASIGIGCCCDSFLSWFTYLEKYRWTAVLQFALAVSETYVLYFVCLLFIILTTTGQQRV